MKMMIVVDLEVEGLTIEQWLSVGQSLILGQSV